MRGQKARSGRGTRPGFEGGQTPMHRRFPKLKGIAGGMGAGRAKYVTVNVDDISAAFAANKLAAGSEVSIESLKAARVIKASGHYRKLPLRCSATGTSRASARSRLRRSPSLPRRRSRRPVGPSRSSRAARSGCARRKR